MPKVLKITDQEWLFAYELVLRGDPIKAIEAAYPKVCSRSVPHKMALVRRLRSRKRVVEEINKIQNEVRATQRLTIDQHLTYLSDIRDEARKAEQYAAAVRAEELRGRAAGFYIEQHVHVTEQLSRDEMRARLAMILEENPHLRELLKQKVQSGELVEQVCDTRRVELIDQEDLSTEQVEEEKESEDTSPSDLSSDPLLSKL